MKRFKELISDIGRLKAGKTVDASKVSLHSDEQELVDKHYKNPNIGKQHTAKDGSKTSYVHWDAKGGKYTTMYRFHVKPNKGGTMYIHRGSHLVPND